MKIIVRGRGTGKTTELLHDAAENNGQVLVANKRAIQVKAERYGITNVPIIDWNDLMYGGYDKNKPLYIDNAELFLERLFLDDFEQSLKGININLED
jgi:hypothetical protein